MRISTIQQYNNGVMGLQRNYSNVTRTQEQISTGNRILTPADDPVASVRLLQLEQQQGVLEQYNSNLTAAKNSLTQEEVTLQSVTTVLQRVKELVGQAGNGALSLDDRKSIAAELAEREDELLALMNTRNARGEYLFAGFQGKSQPFVRQADGSYAYMGDEGQRTLQIASSLEVPISDNGRQVFQNALNAGRLTITDTSMPPAPSDTISGALVKDEVSFSSFPAGGVQITFDSADPKNYTITPLPSGTAVTGRLAEDGDTLVTYGGIGFYVNGTPPASSSFTLAGPGPATSATASDPSVKTGILDSISQLRQVLESSTDGREVRDAVALGLSNVSNGMAGVDLAQGQIGARLNVVESSLTDNEDVGLVNKSVQAELRELDYAEALSRLSFQQLILDASQKSYVAISRLNLFSKM
ncbi:flagellar hook-associated protein FlgL [Pseudomonas sp. JM0905a]|uniref:flagellar hook-associated protein FlgL n=1 Tax=Pseudomonas sp. JM0905a TaxID=2772484 RepID=UPI0016860931|nr:flagellar hook-associated protein FlgL [Pseudomonas sp. JM0905a]MBD2837644.1 flagellar hook-associated protein FlgL [Pseudomonas sp. JM0905a]